MTKMRIKQYTEVLPLGRHCPICIDLDCIESVARYGGSGPDTPNTIVMKSGRSINVAEPVRQILKDWENREKYLLTVTYPCGAVIRGTFNSFEAALSAQGNVKAINADVETTITRQ